MEPMLNCDSSLLDFLDRALVERKRQQLYRERQSLSSPQGAIIVRGGTRLINFSSNDYLGLAKHPALIEAASTAAAHAGVGSGASHLVVGHHDYHHQLEMALAKRTGRDAALLFSSGFSANLGVISALMNRHDEVFEDRLNHASLIDGAKLSGAKLTRFRHQDLAHLAQCLERSSARKKLIVVDSVYSMDGDMAPLKELAALAKEHQSWLMVDDAHGFGWMGKTGAGITEQLNLTQADVPILMGTLGKALGTYGAFIAGSQALIDYLVQFARPYIYSTAMPPLVAAATLASLQILDSEPWRRAKLIALVDQFRLLALEQGLPLLTSSTPIQPMLTGSAECALFIAKRMQQAGYLTVAIRPPTVPEGASRLRITLTAAHTFEQVSDLVATLARVWAESREVGEQDGF